MWQIWQITFSWKTGHAYKCEEHWVLDGWSQSEAQKTIQKIGSFFITASHLHFTRYLFSYIGSSIESSNLIVALVLDTSWFAKGRGAINSFWTVEWTPKPEKVYSFMDL